MAKDWAERPGIDVARQNLEGENDTRNRLLQATIEAIDLGGERAVRIRSIADRAGVTEPSIYHFFGSREGLVEVAQAERFRRNLDDMNARFLKRALRCQTRDEYLGAVRVTLTETFATERRTARLHRFTVIGAAVSRPALLEKLVAARAAGEKNLIEAIEFGRERGWVRTDLNPRAFSYWLAGMVTGRALLEIDRSVSPDIESEWNDLAINSVVAMMVAPER